MEGLVHTQVQPLLQPLIITANLVNVRKKDLVHTITDLVTINGVKDVITLLNPLSRISIIENLKIKKTTVVSL